MRRLMKFKCGFCYLRFKSLRLRFKHAKDCKR
jgi:hypothetical protein